VDAIHPASGKDSESESQAGDGPFSARSAGLESRQSQYGDFGDPLAKNVTDSLGNGMAPVLAAAPVEALVPAKAAAREAERSALA